MKAWLDDGDLALYHGDALAVLSALPAASAQTCVTSPPYWGLRDYGTGTWTGGDATCDHRHETEHQKQGATSQRAGRSNTEEQRNENYRDVCRKCGATRTDSQLGLEASPDLYVERMVAVFREVRRVLRDDGTLWLNLGDSYASGQGGRQGDTGIPSMQNTWNLANKQGRGPIPPGLKPKDLVGIPWRVAFALQADGWYLRSDIIWSKPNPMPESVTDRPTKAHEYLFLLSKEARYFYDADAIREPVTPDGVAREGRARLSAYEAPGQSANRRPPKQDGHGRRHAGFNGRWEEAAAGGWTQAGRNRRSVWQIAPEPYAAAHFATFPQRLVEPCVLAGSRPGDLVLDPFVGSGTTCLVARRLGRRSLGVDLSAEYLRLAAARTQQLGLLTASSEHEPA